MQHTPPHVCLYIQTKHLFTEQGTIEVQTPPYMEETYLWEELNTANHTHFNSTIWQILTDDPYIGRAFCRTPLIGGLARVQALVLPRDSINMESPIFGWYHNTWGWLKMVLVLGMRLKLHVCVFVALIFLPDPYDRARSSLYHVIVGGGMPLEGQRRISELLMLTVKSVKLWSSTGGSKTGRQSTHTHRERTQKTFQAFLFVQFFW